MTPPQKARAIKPLAMMAMLACTGSQLLLNAGGKGAISWEEKAAISISRETSGATKTPKFFTRYRHQKDKKAQVTDQAKKETASWLLVRGVWPAAR